jgi:hypothetical protein
MKSLRDKGVSGPLAVPHEMLSSDASLSVVRGS